MLLVTEDLTKIYKKSTYKALDNLNMEVDAGSIVGFIGPNGAGKTTAMRIISTLMPQTSGEVYLDGEAISKDPGKARKKIGYVPDFFGVYNAISCRDYLNFYADAYKLSSNGREALIDNMLELVSLTDKKNEDVNALSRGMKQRLCLARGLLHNPSLLVLDEPASGLDPQARAELKMILKSLRNRGKAVLISSHILPELGEFCDKVVILKNGKCMAEGTVAEISEKMGEKEKGTVEVANTDQVSLAVDILKMCDFCGEMVTENNKIEVEIKGDENNTNDLLKVLIRSGIEIVGISRTKLSLEQVFLEVMERETSE